MTKRLIAVIQARMTSSRLPGKSLRKISDKALLEIIVCRLQKSKFIDQIIIATSVNKDDDPLAKFATDKGIDCVRGSEENVLSRYLLVYQKYNFDYLVQICGDSPLIDIDFLDFWYRAYLQSKCDFLYFYPLKKHYLGGFDIISKNGLVKILDQSQSQIAQQYIIGFVYQFPELFDIVKKPLPNSYYLPESLQDRNIRLSVDTLEDVHFFEALYQFLDIDLCDISSQDFIRALLRKPELLHLNSHVKQRPLSTQEDKLYLNIDMNKITQTQIEDICKKAGFYRAEKSFGVKFLIENPNEFIQYIKDLEFAYEYGLGDLTLELNHIFVSNTNTQFDSKLNSVCCKILSLEEFMNEDS